MVQEVRQLTFSPAELAEALTEYRRLHQDFLPAGEIWVKGMAKDGALRVRVTMAYGGSQQSAFFDINAPDVVRALVCACQVLQIPVPQKGKKSLVGSSSGVSLKIKVEDTGRNLSNKVELNDFAGARELVDASAN